MMANPIDIGGLFPLYISSPGVKLPEQGTYYVLARDGLYIRKNTGFVTAMVKVPQISFLQELKTEAQLHIPRLPALLALKVVSFFRAIYTEHKSEATLLIHYDQENTRFALECPLQTVSNASVNYQSHERFEGFQLIGTIHSHATMNAFHSGIDTDDEMNFDGLHITIGNMDHKYFTFSCEAVVNNNRFKMAPEQAFEGIHEVDYTPGDDLWAEPLTEIFGLSHLNAIRDEFNIPRASNFHFAHRPFYFNRQFYEIVWPGLEENIPFPKEWMKKVKKQTFFKSLKEESPENEY